MRHTPIATAALLTCLAPAALLASSHREAPNITRLPTVDSTDVYAFMSYEPGQQDYVTLIANYLPLQDAYGGPNYFALDEAAVYDIHVDSDGDTRKDLTFRFTFDNDLGGSKFQRGLTVPSFGQNVAVPLKNIGPVVAGSDNAGTLNFFESYQLEVIRGDRFSGDDVTNAVDGSKKFGKPYDFVGTKTFGSVEGYEAYAEQFVYDINVPNCDVPGRVFVGQRDEPFVVNLGPVFDLVNFVPIDGTVFPGGIMQDPSNDIIRFKNITSLALEVHKSCLTGNGNGVIGVWTSASLPQARVLNPVPTFERPDVNFGALTQVSRLGMPLVNEVVIGLKDKDRFNALPPRFDSVFFGDYVTNPTLPVLIDALFRDAVNATLGTSIPNLAPANAGRDDLVAAFLTGIEGLNQQRIVRAGEMQRLNTGIAPTAKDDQHPLGVAAGDLAGFPNGRRPGDDVVDIELRVAMGALCYPVPINGEMVDLGFCDPADAPVGNQPITDGAPISAAAFDNAFPYLTTPIPGAVGPSN